MDLTCYTERDCRIAFGRALFNEPLLSASPEGVVLVRDITFAALDEETLLPFHGRCHVAYVPRDGVILGLSKLARATRCLSSRLQRQEQLAADLLSAVQREVAPLGVMVVVEAIHINTMDGTSAPSFIGLRPRQAPRVVTATCGSFAGKSSALAEEVMLLLRLDTSNAATGRDLETNARGVGSDIENSIALLERSQLDSIASKANRTGVSFDAMVAAAETLLRSVGEDPSRPGLRSSARRYIEWLQSTTIGYSMQSMIDAVLESGWSKHIEPRTPDDASLTSTSDAFSSSSSASEDVHMDASPCFVHLRENRNACSTDEEDVVLSKDESALPSGIAGYSMASLHGQEVHLFSTQFTSQCEHHLLPFYGSIQVAYMLPSGGEKIYNAVSFLEKVVMAFSRRLQVQERLTQQVAEAVAHGFRVKGALVICESAHMCMVARGVEKHASSTMTTAARGVWAESPDARKSVMKLLLKANKHN